ncbi:flavin-containing monooxygenase [Plakobranchus ocellatus]|uniref:Flavin-containing monooxygenase n=1 Tax=Plakobranchus ocellatus TaxID=259542 RepID=A0AAV4BH12_9GAST|nr:flavin-containing monooxygenase [Plakobranchus ocellatus]
MESNRVMKVAIIGAGAAGLAALRRLTCRTPYENTDFKHEQEPVQFDVVCFEMASEVGGTWLYTDRTGKDKLGRPIFSSMYKNLVTNLPKECMAFLDFPFRDDLPSFMRHEDVLNHENIHIRSVLEKRSSSQRVRYSTPGPFRDCSVRVLKLECLTQAKSRRLAAPFSPCFHGV